MLLTDLMKKVQNIEPTAELRSMGWGNWVVEGQRINELTGKTVVTVLAKVKTKIATTSKGTTVNEIVYARVYSNTPRKKAIRVWMLLWGVPLK